jgi:uncharacterized protein YbjT (DUF2867 family)
MLRGSGMDDMLPIFVSGGTGQVGRCAVRALRERGADVIVGTREPASARALFGDGVAAVRLDFDSPRSLRAALAGVHKLLLCPPSIGEEAKAAVAAQLLEAAADAGVAHVTVLSGISAAHDEASVSRKIERAAERSGLTWTHLRPNHFTQNYGTIYADSIRRGRIDFYMGAGRTSLIDVRDIGGAAAVTLIEDGHAGRVHALTGPDALDQHQIAQILSRATGRRIEYSARSHDDTRRALREAGLPEATIEASVARFAEVEADVFAAVLPDLPRLIGRAPISFEQYARENAACWRA